MKDEGGSRHFQAFIKAWSVVSFAPCPVSAYNRPRTFTIFHHREPMPANNTEIEKRLWEAVDDLHANSKLKSSEYSLPVLDLIFLRHVDCCAVTEDTRVI